MADNHIFTIPAHGPIPEPLMRPVALLLFCLPLGGCAPRASDGAVPLAPAHAAAITDSVRGALTSWRSAIAALDADAVAGHYLADSTFRWLEDGVVRYRDRDEVAAAIRTLKGSIRRTELLLDGTTITPLAPGLAAVTTGFAQKIEDTTGAVGGFAGAISAVMVHRDSAWVFLLGHTSAGAGPR
jgi:hypothetical protein